MRCDCGQSLNHAWKRRAAFITTVGRGRIGILFGLVRFILIRNFIVVVSTPMIVCVLMMVLSGGTSVMMMEELSKHLMAVSHEEKDHQDGFQN